VKVELPYEDVNYRPTALKLRDGVLVYLYSTTGPRLTLSIHASIVKTPIDNSYLSCHLPTLSMVC
jgi:hypothetical protein